MPHLLKTLLVIGSGGYLFGFACGLATGIVVVGVWWLGL